MPASWEAPADAEHSAVQVGDDLDVHPVLAVFAGEQIVAVAPVSEPAQSPPKRTSRAVGSNAQGVKRLT